MYRRAAITALLMGVAFPSTAQDAVGAPAPSPEASSPAAAENPAAGTGGNLDDAIRRAAHTGRLLLNDDFSEWNGDQPAGWEVSLPEQASKAIEADTGRAVLSLKPGATEVDLKQFPNVGVFLPGDMVLFKVECYAEQANDVVAVMRFNPVQGSSGKRLILGESHPGGGWARLVVAFPFPEEPPASIEFRVRVNTTATAPVRVRLARAEIIPAIP